MTDKRGIQIGIFTTRDGHEWLYTSVRGCSIVKPDKEDSCSRYFDHEGDHQGWFGSTWPRTDNEKELPTWGGDMADKMIETKLESFEGRMYGTHWETQQIGYVKIKNGGTWTYYATINKGTDWAEVAPDDVPESFLER